MMGVTIPPPEDLGAFPLVEQVIPRFKERDDETVSVGLDVALLRRLCDALGADKVVLTFKPGIKRESNGRPVGPILVRAHNDSSEGGPLGVLMPLT